MCIFFNTSKTDNLSTATVVVKRYFRFYNVFYVKTPLSLKELPAVCDSAGKLPTECYLAGKLRAVCYSGSR